MTAFIDETGVYVSAEPCHWGMIKIPLWRCELELGVEQNRKQFRPYPYREAQPLLVDKIA
jgi:hypothetical protein